MSMKLAISLMSLWFTSATPALAPLTGQVVAVHDGDTLMVKSGPSLYKVRLSDVDAPELGQVFGKQARNFTKSVALGRRVQVNVTLIDKHDRRIGEVIIEDGRVLNEELVHAGLAWYYRVNPIKNERLKKLEQVAFSNKLGLWVEKEPLPPWEFRRETHIPDAPVTTGQVDYDRIFHYGIIGHRRTKTVRWPACKKYRQNRPQQALVFHSLEQAHQMGFKPAKDCPR
jgi:endonuclease YncB( thermonuclease family)